MSNGPIYTRLFNAPETFGVSVSTVYRWAEKGIVTIHRRGRIAFLRTEEMRAVIEGRAEPLGE